MTLNDSMLIHKCLLSMFSMHLGTNVVFKLSLYYEGTKNDIYARVVLAKNVEFKCDT